MARLLARMRVNGPRRVVSIIALTALGGLLLVLAFGQDVTFSGRVVLITFGGLGLFGAWSVQKSTERDIILTEDGISEEGGRVLAEMENIASVDRGMFAVKPSSGFAVKLKEPMTTAWAPGCWWRIGRRVGIGGAVPGPEARAMAEILELALADRDGKLRRD